VRHRSLILIASLHQVLIGQDHESRKEDAEPVSDWSDIFEVKSPSQLGSSVFDEESEKAKSGGGGADQAASDGTLVLAQKNTTAGGWMFLDAITQEQIATKVTERCDVPFNSAVGSAPTHSELSVSWWPDMSKSVSLFATM
jgi:hypothetical protein